MGLKSFVEKSSGYDNVDVEWISVKTGQSKDLLFLSGILDDSPDFNPDEDLLYFDQFTTYPSVKIKNFEGKEFYMNFPVLDESDHPEDSVNPFFDLLGLFNIPKHGKNGFVSPKFMMWVCEASDLPEMDKNGNYDLSGVTPKLWQVPPSVVRELVSLEEKYGSLKGRVFSVKHPEQTKYNVSAYYLGPQGFGQPAINLDGLQYPNKIIENVAFRTIDEQVMFINRCKDSWMKWVKEAGFVEEDFIYPFEIIDENYNGVLKEEYREMSIGDLMEKPKRKPKNDSDFEV